jgi:hypothetical protein
MTDQKLIGYAIGAIIFTFIASVFCAVNWTIDWFDDRRQARADAEEQTQ